jgi:hypothetical protein
VETEADGAGRHHDDSLVFLYIGYLIRNFAQGLYAYLVCAHIRNERCPKLDYIDPSSRGNKNHLLELICHLMQAAFLSISLLPSRMRGAGVPGRRT